MFGSHLLQFQNKNHHPNSPQSRTNKALRAGTVAPMMILGGGGTIKATTTVDEVSVKVSDEQLPAVKQDDPPIAVGEPMNKPCEDTVVVNKQSTDSVVDPLLANKDAPPSDHSSEIRHLIEEVGKLTEQVKQSSVQTAKIPDLVTSITEWKAEVKNDISELSGRMLLVEERLNKMEEQTLTREGKSVVRSNKSKIENLEKHKKDVVEGLAASVKTVKQSVDTLLQQDSERRLSKLETSMKSLEDSTESSADSTIPYSVDEKRLTEMEENISSLQTLLEQYSKTKSSTSAEKKNEKEIKKRTVELYTCYTLMDVASFTREAKVEVQPSKILMHVGTNDLTQYKDDPDAIAKLQKDVNITINLLRNRFDKARIYVSALLPRNDSINKSIFDANEQIEEHCDAHKRVRFIPHPSISKEHLYDKLHLDNTGFFLLLCNLKFAMFGLLPPQPRKRSR